jgi:sugar/nucleoside kinase (ribokinase family)
MVFNDNDDIFRNTNFDHIDRFRWCNKPENTRSVTSQVNQNNRGICADKDDRTYNKDDITYLERWIDHIKIIKGNEKYLETLNEDPQAINYEVKEYNIKEAG